MKVYAPGKLILSGEHAVVYGQPALAMAVNRYASATISKEAMPQISFHLTDIAHRSRLSLSRLHDLKSRIKRKYQRFIHGEYTIRQVLHKPFELAQVALSMITDSLNMTLPHGVKIHVQSDIPIGCGMGSSAATILCVMHAISKYLEIPISAETLFQLALDAENLQHGQSSGLDLRVATQGGCLYVHDKQYFERPVPAINFYLINTGTPSSTTGECVTKVASHFQSVSLAEEFGAVTNAMDAALQSTSSSNVSGIIKHNHRLLDTIGIVPDKVRHFISTIEAQGGAAKVCGAGAVAGDNAGAVLALVDDASALQTLCARFGYEVMAIAGESRGVYVV